MKVVVRVLEEIAYMLPDEIQRLMEVETTPALHPHSFLNFCLWCRRPADDNTKILVEGQGT